MERLRLSGRLILVTRPGEQAQELRDLFTALGATVLEQPGICVSDPPDWSPVDAAIERIASYDWLVFSSSNGVKRLLDRLVLRGGRLDQLVTVKLAAIGPGTAAELSRYGLKVDIVPKEYRAESLAEALSPPALGKRFLLARASRGRQVLPEQLTAAGGIVEQVVVYSTNDVEAADPQVAAALAAGQVDWVTVTSSAIARSIVGLFGDELRKSRLASISPVTSATLHELGYPPAVEAAEYTMAGLVAAIVASNSAC
jgi:uroporphyrinogen III methyltransferase / synthase